MDKSLFDFLNDVLENSEEELPLGNRKYLAATFSTDYNPAKTNYDDTFNTAPFDSAVNTKTDAFYNSETVTAFEGSVKDSHFLNDFSPDNSGHCNPQCTGNFSSHFGGNFGSVKNSHHASKKVN